MDYNKMNELSKESNQNDKPVLNMWPDNKKSMNQ